MIGIWKKRNHRILPEVEKAIKVRDELLIGVKDAVAEVDRLKDELLDEYREAERQGQLQHDERRQRERRVR